MCWPPPSLDIRSWATGVWIPRSHANNTKSLLMSFCMRAYSSNDFRLRTWLFLHRLDLLFILPYAAVHAQREVFMYAMLLAFLMLLSGCSAARPTGPDAARPLIDESA